MNDKKRNLLAVIVLALLFYALPAGAETSDTPQGTAGVLKITMEDAVRTALANNKGLAVERLSPSITATAEEKAASVFDPQLSGTAAYVRQYDPKYGITDGANLSVSAQKSYETGTSGTVGLDSQFRDKSLLTNQDTSRLSLTVTQALLKGYGREANLVAIKSAAVDTRISAYELRGTIQDLAAQAEASYLDYLLAGEQVKIVDESLEIAKKQADDTDERIKVGKIAEVERFSSEAEMAQRTEDRINALAARQTAGLKLANALGLSLATEIQCGDSPKADEKALDRVDDHAALAFKMRPDLNQARLKMKKGDLDIVRTADGLLPKLDGFIKLGKSGYASSFGSSVGELGGKDYDLSIGVTGNFPVGNRSAEADRKRALLTQGQLKESLSNLAVLAELDVRSAHIEAQRLFKQIAATAATRRLREESFRGESEKFKVGRSTNLLVAQAERDLTQSRIAELQARVNYMKAVIELYRRDGSLLARLGVDAPGAEPVE